MKDNERQTEMERRAAMDRSKRGIKKKKERKRERARLQRPRVKV